MTTDIYVLKCNGGGKKDGQTDSKQLHYNNIIVC